MSTATDARFGIGQVGLGTIAATHRDGYRQYDLPVVAGYDALPQARDGFTEAVPRATAHRTFDALLADPRVGVVDLATPHAPGTRLSLVRAVVEAGKPVLVQKPLAMTYAEAEAIADCAEAAGIPVMVNQSMCFTPNALALRQLLCVEELIGPLAYAQIRTEAKFDADRHPWYGKDERWWTAALSVHHLGLLHHLLGPPESVYSLVGRDPHQPGVTSDGYGHLSMRYPSGAQALLISSGTYYGTRQVRHGEEAAWFQGPGGVVDWAPDGPTVLSVRHPAEQAVIRTERLAPVRGTWFPHAFGLVMHSFQAALAQRAEPWCTAADNLYVMAVVEAAYRSSAEARSVRLDEVMGDRFDPAYGPGCHRGRLAWTAPDVMA